MKFWIHIAGAAAVFIAFAGMGAAQETSVGKPASETAGGDLAQIGTTWYRIVNGPENPARVKKGIGFYGIGQLVDWNRRPPYPVLIPIDAPRRNYSN